jgi:hypothetical protein
MIKYPSTGQFRDAIKQVTSNAKYHNLPVPTLTFEGTVKMHGSNLSFVRPLVGDQSQIVTQSRERIITIESDNAGSAVWGQGNLEVLNNIFNEVSELFKDQFAADTPVQIVGEWCGGSIQKGVGLNQLPKMYVVFAIRIAEDEDANKHWLSSDLIKSIVGKYTKEDLFHTYQFPTWKVEVDFNRPDLAQNRLVELTELVENRCPVADQLLGDKAVGELVGEGLVWTPVANDGELLQFINTRFKTKGEKHSVSKVKTIAAVDPEKFDNMEKFVDAVATKNRLDQGIDKLKEMGLEIDMKNMGAYIKWVMGDIAREEADTLYASGLTMKEVNGKIANVARQHFSDVLNQNVFAGN